MELAEKALKFFESNRRKANDIDRADLYRKRPEVVAWIQRNDRAAEEIAELLKEYGTFLSRVEALRLNDYTIANCFKELNAARSSIATYRDKKTWLAQLTDKDFVVQQMRDYQEVCRNRNAGLSLHNLPAYLGVTREKIKAIESRLEELRAQAEWRERTGRGSGELARRIEIILPDVDRQPPLKTTSKFDPRKQIQERG